MITKEDLEEGIRTRKKTIDNLKSFLNTRTSQENKKYSNIMEMIQERIGHELYMIGVCKRKLKKQV